MARKKIKKQKGKNVTASMTKEQLKDFLDETNEFYKLIQCIHPGLIHEENKIIKNPINDDSD